MAYSATWLNFASLAQKGAFEETWMSSGQPTHRRTLQHSLRKQKQQATVNGSYYCVPSLLSTYNAYGPIYRGDLVEGTEWDGKMETFEDIEEYCDIIKETQSGNGVHRSILYSTGNLLHVYENQDWQPSTESVICGMIQMQKIQLL